MISFPIGTHRFHLRAGAVVIDGGHVLLHRASRTMRSACTSAWSCPPDAPINDRAAMHLGVEGQRRLEFSWFPLSSLRDVDFRPIALRDALAEGVMPTHFVQG
jgi:hypothetical protein